MALLLVRVREEFRGDALRMDALRHEVVAPVAQHADQLGGERVVELLEHRLAVGAVAGGHRALVEVLAGALAQGLNVGQKAGLVHGNLGDFSSVECSDRS